jgi:NAD(P)-dependent dehydrogenase (short-subunit alcohol dehydrogenase family)
MAECFAAEGMKLALADIEGEVLANTVADLESRGAEVVGVECDISEPESVANLAEQTLSAHGSVHVLCNNAGVVPGAMRGMWESSLDDWEWVIGVNLMGTVHGIRSFIPIMLEQGGEGHIVNTASMAGLVSGLGSYGVTKSGIVSLSESLLLELQGRGAEIGVSVMCPGWVSTRLMEAERNRPEAPREDLVHPTHSQPIRVVKRPGSLWESAVLMASCQMDRAMRAAFGIACLGGLVAASSTELGSGRKDVKAAIPSSSSMTPSSQYSPSHARTESARPSPSRGMPRPMIGVDDRKALRVAVGGVRIGRHVPSQIRVEGVVGVQVRRRDEAPPATSDKPRSGSSPRHFRPLGG